MLRLSFGLAGAILFAAPSVFAQQPLCIPGTTWCLPNAANGQVNGGANGQVGPNGANGNANGNGNGQVQQPRPPPAYVPPPPPPPTYLPPQPPPPQPPPYIPPPAPLPPPAPTYPQQPASYGPRSASSLGLAPLPIMRVGVDSGFHLGGGLVVGVRGERWGGEFMFAGLGGGTTGIFDISLVPAVVLRVGDNTGCKNCYDGLYFVGGPELRISISDKPKGDEPDIFGLGLQAGVGYELPVSSWISWKVLDARAFGAWRPDHLHPAFDNFEHHFEFGALFLTGFDFVSGV
ncbi:MAG: hypothetical protein ABI551_08575 [Polyangiaceae bacterium]